MDDATTARFRQGIDLIAAHPPDPAFAARHPDIEALAQAAEMVLHADATGAAFLRRVVETAFGLGYTEGDRHAD